MTDVGLYSALASVAAIATGVQSAVALAVQTAPAEARAEWSKALGAQAGQTTARAGIRRRGAALVVLAVGLGIVTGTAVISWASTVLGQQRVELALVAPLAAVAVLAAGSLAASVLAGIEVFLSVRP